jgi:hypothetical protein
MRLRRREEDVFIFEGRASARARLLQERHKRAEILELAQLRLFRVEAYAASQDRPFPSRSKQGDIECREGGSERSNPLPSSI